MSDFKKMISDIEDMLVAKKENKFTMDEMVDIFCYDFAPRIIGLLKIGEEHGRELMEQNRKDHEELERRLKEHEE